MDLAHEWLVDVFCLSTRASVSTLSSRSGKQHQQAASSKQQAAGSKQQAASKQHCGSARRRPSQPAAGRWR